MGRRILIVEDHPSMRYAMRIALEEGGFQIDEAPDGDAAISLLQQDPPDLVILDLSIPGSPGPKLIRTIRSDPATSDVRLVVVSAWGEPERAEVLELGVDDYVTKPFSPSVLIQTAERVLGDSAPPGS
jgi:DNA-binding response OmpR family regulator